MTKLTETVLAVQETVADEVGRTIGGDVGIPTGEVTGGGGRNGKKTVAPRRTSVR